MRGGIVRMAPVDFTATRASLTVRRIRVTDSVSAGSESLTVRRIAESLPDHSTVRRIVGSGLD
jgi:hypothetical protein